MIIVFPPRRDADAVCRRQVPVCDRFDWGGDLLFVPGRPHLRPEIATRRFPLTIISCQWANALSQAHCDYIIIDCQRLALLIICATEWADRGRLMRSQANATGSARRERDAERGGRGPPPDDGRRRQRGARVPDNGFPGAQSRRRRAPLGARRASASSRRRPSSATSPDAAAARRPSRARDDRLHLRRNFDRSRGRRSRFDGVREKAWERGLTVTVAATRGDVDMEAAALAQLASQPLRRSDLRHHQHPPRRSSGDVAADLPIVLAELSRRQRRAAVGRARRTRRRPRRHRFPASRRPPAHRLHQRRAEHGGLAATV